ELKVLLELLAKVEASNIDATIPDRMTYISKENLYVKECYRQLGNKDKRTLPTKIMCFNLLALNIANLTMDSLNMKAYQLVTDVVFIIDAYASWSRWKVDKTINKALLMIPAAIFWRLQNERNRRWFDGQYCPK
ncbi:hypothetical protein H5410_051036, partial [Solanum commersonii]